MKHLIVWKSQGEDNEALESVINVLLHIVDYVPTSEHPSETLWPLTGILNGVADMAQLQWSSQGRVNYS